MIDQFFEGPEGDQRRKSIEKKLKEKFSRGKLDCCDESFQFALAECEEGTEKAALEYAADDINAMVATITLT